MATKGQTHQKRAREIDAGQAQADEDPETAEGWNQ